MKITVEISMYPLDSDYKPAIRAFIHELRGYGDIETVTNQMSTQVRGEFDDVMPAVTGCIKESMSANRQGCVRDQISEYRSRYRTYAGS